MMNAIRLFSLYCALALLGACATQPSHSVIDGTSLDLSKRMTARTNLGDTLEKPGSRSEFYNTLYAMATPANWKEIQSLAADPATSLTFSSDDAVAHITLKAKIAFLKRHYYSTISQCEPMLNNLSEPYHSRCLELTAASYQHIGKYNSQLAIWKQLAARPEFDERWWYSHSADWLTRMMDYPTNKLQRFASYSHDPFSQAFWNLAIIAKQSPTAETLSPDLGDWQARYIGSPAAMLTTTSDHRGKQPRRIAMLLPLSGSIGVLGGAIRDGYIAAYNQALHDDPDNTPQLTVRFYDTNNNHADELYKRVLEEGADLIVGPLRKEAVESVYHQFNGEIPVLALNRVTNSLPTGMFTLSLAHADESEAAAVRMAKDGHQHALLIRGSGTSEAATAEAFQQMWLYIGGDITDEVVMGKPQDLKTLLRDKLGIHDSEQRAVQFRSAYKLGNQPLKFLPRRRQDFDSIFIAVNHTEAKQLKPMLNFLYAAGVPVYSTSMLNPNSDKPAYDGDLRGIRFTDMPAAVPTEHHSSWWQLPMATVNSLWAANDKQRWRFVALGIDAYLITQKLDTLTSIRDVGLIDGATGRLSMSQQGTIRRGLDWYVGRKSTLQKLLPPP